MSGVSINSIIESAKKNINNNSSKLLKGPNLNLADVEKIINDLVKDFGSKDFAFNSITVSNKRHASTKQDEIFTLKDINLEGSIGHLKINNFFSPIKVKDSKYGSNIILNNSINMFTFGGSTTPDRKTIFDVTFKTPTKDNYADLSKHLFGLFANSNVFKNITHLKDLKVAKNKINIEIDESANINFIFIENTDVPIIYIKTRLPITIITSNSNFNLEYTFENIDIPECIQTVCPSNKKSADSESKACPKQSCPVCENKPCPKQSCPECKNKQCPTCKECPICKVCVKEQCPTNFGWIGATVTLLILTLILFSIILFKKDKNSQE